jgi:hypothetical protein
MTTSFTRKAVEPLDIIDAAKTMDFAHIHSSAFLDEQSTLGHKWVPAETYLEWAEQGLRQNNAHGWDAALSYAKRAACRRIDGFLCYNHLRKLEYSSFPAKIGCLAELGISIPSVVQNLVIDPRNESEHRYREVTGQEAEHAVGIARLLLTATREEAGRRAVIALQWNVVHQNSVVSPVTEFKDHPMLLVDIFRVPNEVKVVRPKEGEIEFAMLDDFSGKQAVELATLLRRHYEPWDSTSNRCLSTNIFEKVIRAARI